MATNQQSTQWDLGRFVKTLSYFGAIPFLSDLDWFQQWLGSRAHPSVDSTALSKSNSSMPTHKLIFDFTQPSSDLGEVWGALDDVVMGGVSQSGLQLGAAGAFFSGTVSTANSGGFASVRTRNFEPPIDLSGFAGIELRVKGDGNRYKFMLRTETRWDGIAHCYSFDTTPDTWITVQIPFTAFVPVFRAKTVNNAPLDPSRIHAMQLMLSKFEYDGGLNPHFEPGFFQLQIESIQAYSG
ncbi:CIA30 family protein [Thermocoleostomius sinensis]|uniref:CIA30 family protein n=1 Tax=Thermocoleostomius sinensis A174 TaxID=2016057 RepID=A0A9E9CBU6_9CYAN|nr:CIA30 family protein [Thermocoleostomius sinensis]WAL61190.1 CIA30 family protein [Thermocoleostomius sinensis A174]